MVIFIIPGYNEEENIELLLSNINSKMKELNATYHIILVNDGSTDSTKEKALKFQSRIPLEIIDHDANMGVGQVFKTGFSRALELAKETDIIVTKEADNTSNLDILDRMLKEINSGYDLVLASCYASGGKIVGTTFDRIILSSVANLIIKLFFPIKGVHTYSSFYRAYKAGMLKKAFFAYENHLIEEDSFACMVEMLIKLRRLPIRIAEVPMLLRCDFRKGRSKMNKKKTIFGCFSLIKRELFRYRSKDINDIVLRYKR